MTLIAGARITLGRTEYQVPALTARQFVKFRGVFSLMAQLAIERRDPNEAEIGAVVEVVHAALSRNYPDLSLDTVWDTLDLGNLQHVMAAIAGQSGLGEGQGQAVVNPSTGPI